MRRTSALLLSLGLVATLAACTPAAEDSTADRANEACEPVASGASSEAITVAGDFEAQPEISFEGPLEPEETERTVVILALIHI